MYTSTGEPVVVLGLSGENVVRLMQGRPVPLDMAELGLPSLQVVIVYGDTEDAIRQDLVRSFGTPKETRDFRPET